MTRTILLADDSVTIQKVIELTFMEEDYEVVSASDGDEALERLEEITPDFVIADVHMPGASGIDVCRRSKELHPNVPVLLLVGTFEPFDEKAAQAAGADAHLKKPFDSQELIQLVGDLMSAPEAEEAAEAAPAAATAGPAPAGEREEADDTWGFSSAAAELRAAEEPATAYGEPEPPVPEAEEPSGDLDWAGTLEPLPEEEEPPAASQAEEPAPTWARPAETARSEVAAEPFHLGPVEPAARGGEVFAFPEESIEEAAEEAPEPAAAGAPADAGWGAEGWGFAMEESAPTETAAAADTGWEEVDEPPAAAGDAAWGESEEEEAASSAAPWEAAASSAAGVAAPPPDWDGEAESDLSAPPPDWDGEAEAEVSAPPPDWDGEAEAEVAAPPPDWDGEAESDLSAPPPDRDGEAEEARVSAPPPDWGVGEETGVSAPPPDRDGEAAAAGTEAPAEEWAAGDSGVAEPVPASGAAYGGAIGVAPPSAPADAAGAGAASAIGLSEQDVDRIARRVAELLGERVTREVAWEVVPDLAEVVIRERLRELEGQID